MTIIEIAVASPPSLSILKYPDWLRYGHLVGCEFMGKDRWSIGPAAGHSGGGGGGRTYLNLK